MKKKLFLSLGIIFLILIIDQVLKIWIKTTFSLGESINLIGDKIQLHFVENPGMAFGMEFGGSTGKIFLSIFRILAVGGLTTYLIYLIKRKENNYLIIFISLIIAGAFGNVIDCMFYGMIFDKGMVFDPSLGPTAIGLDIQELLIFQTQATPHFYKVKLLICYIAHYLHFQNGYHSLAEIFSSARFLM